MADTGRRPWRPRRFGGSSDRRRGFACGSPEGSETSTCVPGLRMAERMKHEGKPLLKGPDQSGREGFAPGPESRSPSAGGGLPPPHLHTGQKVSTFGAREQNFYVKGAERRGGSGRRVWTERLFSWAVAIRELVTSRGEARIPQSPFKTNAHARHVSRVSKSIRVIASISQISGQRPLVQHSNTGISVYD